jgi:hypothetical protein
VKMALLTHIPGSHPLSLEGRGQGEGE